MPQKKTVRMALDIIMTIMIVFEMLIQYTGTFLHEVVGFAFFVTVAAHLALAASWMKGTARNAKAGKLGGRRAALAVMGSLLAFATLALGVSSIAISGILSDAGFVWPFGSYAFWRTVHTVSAYAFCMLVVVHLAMHWVFLATTLKVPFDPSRRRAISTSVNAVAALGVVALGVTAAKALSPSTLATTAENADAASNGNTTSGIGGNTSSNATSNSSNPSSGRGKHSADSAERNSGSAASPQETTSDNTAQSDSGTSGICTLCKKRCSLSAPKCDKPYQAGLI